MSKVVVHLSVNTRAYNWIKHLTYKEKVSSVRVYMEQVLLRHLEQHPEVDLSQSPFSQKE